MIHKDCSNLKQEDYFNWKCEKSGKLIGKLESLCDRCHFEPEPEKPETVEEKKNEQPKPECKGYGLPHGYSGPANS